MCRYQREYSPVSYDYKDLKPDLESKDNEELPWWGRLLIIISFFVPIILYLISR